MKPIQVLLAEDQDLYATGMRAVLSACPDIDVLELHADNGPKLVELLQSKTPDVLALDVYMPDFSLVPFITDYRTSSGRQAKIVLVTTGTDPATLLAVRRQINGLLLKSDPLADILPDAIRSVHQGRRFVSPRAAEMIESALSMPDRLTKAQYKIVSLMASGSSPDDIAMALHISVQAVYSHQDRVRQRLGVESNTEVVIWFLKSGQLSDHES